MPGPPRGPETKASAPGDLYAAVLREVGQPLTLETLAMAPLRPDDVACTVIAAGLCRTDVAVADGVMIRQTPLVLGHECVVRPLAASGGERFVITPYPVSKYTSQSRDRALRYRAQIPVGDGLRAADGSIVHQFAQIGAFATMVVVDRRRLIPLDAAVPDEIAAVIGCAVTTGVDAIVDTAEVTPEDDVVVVGCGGVGLSAIMGARWRGSRVTAVDTNPEKEAAAFDAGAAAFIQADTAGAAAIIDALPNLPTVVVEAAGSTAAIATAIGIAAPGARVVLVGSPPDDGQMSISAPSIVGNELRVLGHANLRSNPQHSVARVVEGYRTGGLPLDRLVSASFPLVRINEAFAEVRAGRVRKSVIIPDR